MTALQMVDLPFDVASLPSGFFGAQCCNLLFQLARRAGSVLEIGPWIGRSTVVIAHGLAGRVAPFTTIDYFVQSDEDWQMRFRQRLADKRNQQRYRRVMAAPGGARGVLEQNLEAQGVRSRVQVVQGDALTHDFGRRFDLIFADATHWEWEIDRTVPRCLALLEPGGVLACHDITTPALEAAVLKHGRWAWHHTAHKLFYGQVAA